MPKSARERKQKARERSKEAVKVSRRAGRVTTFVSQKAKQPKPAKAKTAYVPEMRKPKGLSAAARFMELRPNGYSPIDWWELFHPDEELWPAIVEEAEYVRDMTCPLCRQYGDGCQCSANDAVAVGIEEAWGDDASDVAG